MKELTWEPILLNLTEALGEIRGLHRLLHFLQFRELPEEDNPSLDNADYVRSLMGAIIGDVVGSRWEFGGCKTKDFRYLLKIDDLSNLMTSL